MALKVGELFATLGLDTKGYDKGLDAAAARGKKWVGGAEGASSKVAMALGGVGLAAAAGIGLATNAAGDFEHEISAVGAVSQATNDELKGLTATGLRIGRDTQFSATEAASAMEVLAANGVSARDIMNGAADAAVNLAAAGGTNLTLAADAASTSMAVWGLRTDQLTDVVNRLAGAANVSRFGVDDMSQAIAMGGGAAKLTGVEFGDFATAIAAIAPSFSSGSDAGTSFKQFLAGLTPNTKQASKKMAELGIITKDGANQFFDAKGNLKEFTEIVRILNTATKNLSEEQKSQAFSTIFGSDAMRAAGALAAITGDEFKAMSDKMGGTSAADIAKQRMDNMRGGLEQLKGSIESAGISLGLLFTPLVKEAALALARGIPEAIDRLILMFGFLADHMQVVAPLVVALAGAILGALVPALVAWATTASAAAIAMIVALAPFALAGAAIALLAAGLVFAWRNSETFRTVVTTAFLAVQAVVMIVFTAIRSFVGEVWPQIHEIILLALEAITRSVTSVLDGLRDFWAEWGGTITGFLKGTWQTISDGVRVTWTLIKDVIKGALDVIAGALNIWIGLFTGDWDRVWRGIVQVVRGAANIVIGIVNAMIGSVETLVNTLSRALGKIPGMPKIPTVSLPRIPSLAEGGVAGPSLAQGRSGMDRAPFADEGGAGSRIIQNNEIRLEVADAENVDVEGLANGLRRAGFGAQGA